MMLCLSSQSHQEINSNKLFCTSIYIYITILEYIEYVFVQSRGCKKEKTYLEYMGPNMVLRIFFGFYFFLGLTAAVGFRLCFLFV